MSVMGETMYVYLVRESGERFVKIGVAVDPAERLEQLQIGSPRELLLVYTVQCDNSADARRLEMSLHQRYQQFRVRGEWFDVPIQRIIDDLDWCLEVAQIIRGVTLYRQDNNVEADDETDVDWLDLPDPVGYVLAKLHDDPQLADMGVRPLARHLHVRKSSVGKARDLFLAKSNGHLRENE